MRTGNEIENKKNIECQSILHEMHAPHVDRSKRTIRAHTPYVYRSVEFVI